MHNPYSTKTDRKSFEQLERIPTPAPEGIYRPIAHSYLLDLVREKIDKRGMKILEEDHVTSRGNQRYFGILSVQSDSDDSTKMIGIRNSHDKSVSAAVCGGERVTVCSNMLFYGDVMIARKHTTNIFAELGDRVDSALDELMESWMFHESRMDEFKKFTNLTPNKSDHLIMEAYRRKAIKKTEIADVSESFRNPEHEEFKNYTAWSFLQAFTEVWKGSTTSLHELPTKSQKVISMIEDHVRFENTSLRAYNAEF